MAKSTKNTLFSSGISLSEIRKTFRAAQVGAFSAQAAFFVLLSAMPFFVFLSAVLRYVPWSEADPIELLPETLRQVLAGIKNEGAPSAAVLSVSAVTALWSASRGIVAVTRGLNSMFGLTERRSYVLLRFFAFAETLILEIVLLCTLGGSIRSEELRTILGIEGTAGMILQKTFGVFLLTGFFLFLYALLPDHTTSLRNQFPGAFAAAVGWTVFTEGYSFYVEKIANFSRLYGTLSNMAMLMLWLYLCLYLFFLGALLNRFLQRAKELEHFDETFPEGLDYKDNSML